FVDDLYLGSRASNKPIDWRPIDNGRDRSRAVDERGRADTRLVTIEWVN
ncbi:penicillin-binding protein 1C, partial [Klebsiella pneumoniae]|nr:penicillin-binding protein 1C [Klebsiella pneumoniae]